MRSACQILRCKHSQQERQDAELGRHPHSQLMKAGAIPFQNWISGRLVEPSSRDCLRNIIRRDKRSQDLKTCKALWERINPNQYGILGGQSDTDL